MVNRDGMPVEYHFSLCIDAARPARITGGYAELWLPRRVVPIPLLSGRAAFFGPVPDR